MENLTRAQDIVREVGDPRPVPGYSLVIFREENGGRILHRVLGSREPFRPNLFERLKSDFVAYAVSDDPELRYRFSHQLFLWDDGRVFPYTLEIVLLFRVSHPETLVEKLSNDPLARLRQEIEDVLQRRAEAIPFKCLQNHSLDLEATFLETGGHTAGTSELRRGTLERLQAFASRVGMHLAAIELRRNPPPVEIERTKHETDTRVAREKAAIAHQTEILRNRQAGEIATLKAQNHHQARAIERATTLLDDGAKQLGEALKTIAQNTNSASSLRETIRQFVDLRRDLTSGPLAPPSWEGGQAELPQLPGGGMKALPAAGAHLDPLSREIDTMRRQLEDLDARPSQLRALSGRILHLLAELSLGEEADEERLESYAQELHEYGESIQLGAILGTATQHQYFRKLRDLDEMRRAFSPGQDPVSLAEEVTDV